MIIRDMTRHDIGQVYETECECFRTPWSRMSLMSELRNDIAVYQVLEEGNTICGYGGMWILFEEAHVTNIAVRAPYRRQGHARKLLLTMMQRALLRGATKMTLEVRETNMAAQNLYAQLDFLQNGYRKRYYEDTGEGALLLWNTDIAKTVEKFKNV